MYRKITSTLTLVLLSYTIFAQLSLDGQLRPRAEFRDGYRMLPSEGEKPAAHINQRTRLSLSYAFERVSTRVSVQDLRLWGEHMTTGTRPSFGLYEAWLRLELSERLSVQAGRQELRYDNQRLMAVNDWALSARSHDALVFRYETEGGSALHIGGAFNQSQDRLFGTEYALNNYKTLNYIWYNTSILPALDASFHFIADGYQNPADPQELNIRATWASYLVMGNGRLQLRFYPAYQHGRTRHGEEISAWYLMGEAVTPITERWNTTLGVEIFSGTDHLDTNREKFNAFDDLYGVGHGRNGYMDYFTSLPGHTRLAGLINPYLRNSFRLSGSTNLSADLHLFFLQNNYPDPADNLEPIDKYLGTELDLVLNHRFNEITQIIFGYSVMFGSESMEVIKGGSSDEFAHWAFLMVRLSPKFL